MHNISSRCRKKKCNYRVAPAKNEELKSFLSFLSLHFDVVYIFVCFFSSHEVQSCSEKFAMIFLLKYFPFFMAFSGGTSRLFRLCWGFFMNILPAVRSWPFLGMQTLLLQFRIMKSKSRAIELSMTKNLSSPTKKKKAKWFDFKFKHFVGFGRHCVQCRSSPSNIKKT